MRRPSIVHRLNGGRRSSPVACSHVRPGRHDPCRAVRLGARLQLHLPAVLFAWFWLGMFLCGLLAPADRVVGLDSALVQEGWHLSVMCCVLGLPVVVLYV